jgi:hypothetical protein
MIVTKNNDGKPIGFIETYFSDKKVTTVNAAERVTTVTTRDRNTGRVKTETFFGTLPLTPRS